MDLSKIEDLGLLPEVESILVNDNLAPFQKDEQLRTIKDRPYVDDATDGVIDEFYRQFQTAYTGGRTAAEALRMIQSGGGSIPSSGSGTLTVYEAIRLLHHYVDQRRHEVAFRNPLDEGVLSREQQKFDEYYVALMPRVPEKDRSFFNSEYRSLRKFGFTRPELRLPVVVPGPVYRFGDMKGHQGPFLYNDAMFLFGAYHLLLKSVPDNSMFQFAPPANPLEGARFTSRKPFAQLTPAEKQALMPVKDLRGLVWVTSTLRPWPQAPTYEEAQAAGEADYLYIGPFSSENINPALYDPVFQWYYDTLIGTIAESSQVALYERMKFHDYDISYRGIPGATPYIKTALSLYEGAVISKNLAEVQADIELDQQLSMGDGSQCTSAESSEVDYFRETHPEYASWSDQRILDYICGLQTYGANDAFDAGQSASRYRVRANYRAAGMNNSLYGTSMLWRMPSPGAKVAAVGVAAARPLVNAAVAGQFNEDRILGDYAIEGFVFAETLASGGDKDRLRVYSLANEIVAEVENDYSNIILADHVFPEGAPTNKTSASNFIYAGDNMVQGITDYTRGQELGSVCYGGYRSGDAGTFVQDCLPLAVGAGAEITRSIVVAHQLQEVKGNALSEEDAQDYSPPTEWIVLPEVFRDAMFAGGVFKGFVSSVRGTELQSQLFGATYGLGMGNGLVGADIPTRQGAVSIGLTPGFTYLGEDNWSASATLDVAQIFRRQ